jgi:2-polyprenyl-6-methoxyphenol hydroxylase-like FAD-dependent oxidoreductase
MHQAAVIIIGAGIGGLAAALALQRAGVHVRLYEQSPTLGEVGAGLSISPNGALGLKSLGVFDEFRDVAFAPDEQVVRHYKTARVLATVSRGARLEATYGERYYVVHRAEAMIGADGVRLLNFVAFAGPAGWEEEGWSIPGSVEELAGEFRDWHPWVTGVIAAVPPESLFKWALCARSPLTRWVCGRAALLGDAAHPLLPYLGQGAVMAIEDAVLLGRAVHESADLPEALGLFGYDPAMVPV